MKTIIIYATKHGTTKKIADDIASKLKDDVEVVDVKKIKEYNLRIFDKIIIGGSIHAGSIQSSIKVFCKENSDLLKEKVLGLFITCMFEEEGKRQEQLKNAFPDALIKHSRITSILGGEFLFEKMSFVEKLMVKIIAKKNKTTSKIDDSAIKEFVRVMNKK